MAAKYILAALGAAFLIAGSYRRLTAGPGPQASTWLLVGAIFVGVAVFLFVRG
jgi:hypothetical protein